MVVKRKQLSLSDKTQLLHDVHNYGINIYSREIFINGYLSDAYEEDPGIDYKSAQYFLKNLSVLEMFGRSKITIHMQISGGEWSDGMAMFDAIRSSKSHITIISYAQASSMSGVLLQAADHRVLMPNTHFMLHYGSVGVESSSNVAAEVVRFNNLECKKMLQIFTERAVEGPFFKSKRWGSKRISEYLDNEMNKRGDWYLTAEEAVEMGFADEIF
jgi:ATP-dependent protease ClpP protease subunit